MVKNDPRINLGIGLGGVFTNDGWLLKFQW
jgi:hypothetical protein